MIEHDIQVAAHAMIQLYGADAGILSTTRARKLLEMKDPHGCVVWGRVAVAIRELEYPVPS
jgi:hypothetical protein